MVRWSAASFIRLKASGWVYNPIGLANEGHVTGLFGFGAPCDFIDIRHAEPGYLNLFNVPDLEVAMQRRSGLIITVGLQLYLTLFA
jgi:hypothetical protein